jgi:hypothetical protein
MKNVTWRGWVIVAVGCGLVSSATSLPGCRNASGVPSERVMILGSGTVVDGIFNPLKDTISSLAQVSFEAQDHGSGKALQTAVEPAMQPAIAVRSSRARNEDFAAANVAKSFRCVVAVVLAYDSIAFWVHQDHPLRLIELDKLKDLLFKETVDDALPTWASVGLPLTDTWAQRKIAILMPRGPLKDAPKGVEDSGTRREAECLLSGSAELRFSLEGQWLRSSEDISKIPQDVESKTSGAVAPMGLASAAFVRNAKVRPLAIYDSLRRRNFDFGVRPLWAYVLLPRNGAVPDAVLRTIHAVLTETTQAYLERKQFRRLGKDLISRESQMLEAVRAGDCSGGRSSSGLTIVEPPEDLLAK